jgi:hypothetical protein
VQVHFIIASCENMVHGKGLRPGDVLMAANGKTVEVNNTDAEGRLTLADALWFAQEKAGATVSGRRRQGSGQRRSSPLYQPALNGHNARGCFSEASGAITV